MSLRKNVSKLKKRAIIKDPGWSPAQWDAFVLKHKGPGYKFAGLTSKGVRIERCVISTSPSSLPLQVSSLLNLPSVVEQLA